MKNNINKKIGATLLTAAVMTGTFITPIAKADAETVKPYVSGSAHVQYIGWMNFGENGIAGTTGAELRLEALKDIKIENCENVELTFDVHVQNIGWMYGLTQEQLLGTEGAELRLEAIVVHVNGNGLNDKGYKLQYRAHVQYLGWMDWVDAGNMAGTTGAELRMEAVEFRVVENMTAVKENAVNDLSSSVDMKNYSEEQQAEILKILEEAESAINAESSKEAIDAIVEATKAKLNEVPTLAQELETAKSEMEDTLKTYDAVLKEKLGKDTPNYKEMSAKIATAMENIGKAENIDDTKSIFDAIVNEVTNIMPGIESMTERAKEERDVAAKLFEEILAKYEEISKGMVESGELTTNDLGIIATIIDNAREATNEAKTQTEVTEAQTEFENLLTASSYNKLVQKVDNATKLQKAQQDANATLSAYKEALDGMTESEIDSYDRAIIESEIQEAKEAIEKAETDEKVKEIMDGFEEILNTGKYQKVREAANDKLIATALDKAVAELEVYTAEKYASYIIEPEEGEDSAVTVKSKAEDYIEAIKKIASGIETVDKSQIVNKIESNLASAKTYLDSEITRIEAEIKENYDQYLTAYNKAVKELDEYATDANAQLTGKTLEDIIGLINDTKAKIANDVDTVAGVDDAMSLFRSTVETYAPEFAKAEATKAQTNAIAELEKYENSTDERISQLAREALIVIRNGKNADGKDMTANEITTKLNNTLNDINGIIEAKELAELKEEKIAEFREYLNYTENETIKATIEKLASQAIDEIGKCENKKDVNTTVETYLAKIDTELQKGESSLQQRIEKARQEALTKIAEYEELATKTNEISLISAIIPYENKINAANATVQSINDTLVTVQKMIEENYDYINQKIDAINEINALTGEESKEENIKNNKDVKEVKDAIAVAIENIKNAQKPTDITDIKTKNINDIKEIARNVNTMETARQETITTIQKYDITDKTTGDEDDNIANGSAAGLVNNYINEVKAVTLAQYNENTNIFTEISNRAKADIDTFIKNIVKSTVNFDYQVKDQANPQEQTGYFGQLVTMPKDPEVSDSTLKFKGWYDSSDPTKTTISETEIKFTDENKTYKALWDVEITPSEGAQSAENINSAIKDLEKLDLNEGESTTIKVDTSAENAKTFSIESNIEIPAQVVLEFTDDVTLSKSSESTTLSAKGGAIKFDSNVTITEDTTLQAGENGNIKFEGEVTIDDNATLKADENGTINFGGNVIVDDKGTLDVTSDTMKKENDDVTITKQVATDIENNKLQTSLNNEIFDVVQLNAVSELVETSAVTINPESNATLDLNGKKLKSRADSSAIVNEGNLTITDSTVPSVTTYNTRAVESTAQIQSTAGNTIENKGTLTIEGGIFDAVKDDKSALVNDENATVTLNGGKFMRSAENGSNNTYYTVVNKGDMTIKDGAKLYNNNAYSSLITNGYYKSNDVTDKKAKLTIEGGTFKGGKYVVKNDYAGILNVTGGDYTAVNGTKCIFKTIGKMELDLVDPENTETKNNLKFNVTGDSSIEAIVLVGDQKVASSELKDGQNTLEVYGFDFKELITGSMEGKKEINVEKDISNTKLCQSNIIVHIYDQSILHTLIKDYINADCDATIDATNNVNQIVLETDVDLTVLEDEISEWKNTANDKYIIIDLNGHNIKCTSEYKLNNTGKIRIIDSVGKGRITVGDDILNEDADYPKTPTQD